MRRSRSLALLLALLAGASLPFPQTARAATVEEVIDDGCSTTAVWGLSVQIVDEVNCLVPGALAEVPDRPNLSMGSAVFPFLQAPARDALLEALDDHAATTLNVSSMLRTVAQQYLLYRWYQAGTCGIPLAATPGNSNHEQGRALDTGSYATWDTILDDYGWDWYGNSDVYHFTYTGPGWVNLQGTDVLAFQRLWNRNHPEDLIDEDGIYGPQTGARLSASPADGFPLGAEGCCGDVTATGECAGNLLRRCGGAGLEERDCAAEGLVCGLNPATQQNDCLDPCGDLTATGRCEGNVLRWCDGGPQSSDCAAEGLVCGADPGTGDPACIDPGTSPDGGTPGPDSGTPGPDSGTPGPDGSAPADAGSTPDGGPGGPGWATNGCACTAHASPDAGLPLLLLIASVLLLRRRRRQ